MADGSAKFEYELDGSPAAAGAGEAAEALERMGDSILGGTRALRAMQGAMRNFKAAGIDKTSPAAQRLNEIMKTQKARLAEMQEKYVQQGGSFKAVKKETVSATSALQELSTASAQLPGPLGKASGILNTLKGIVGGSAGAGTIAGGVLAIAGAMGVLAGAVLAAAAALARYGIAAADARRTELLQLEGLTKVRNWYGRAADSGSFLQETIDRVHESSALSRGELVQYTQQLYNMGLRAGNLQAALEGVSIASSADPSGRERQRFMAMATAAQWAGGSVRRLADDVKARMGEIAQRRLLSLDVQSKKLKENLGLLFSELKISELLKGLKEITGLFSRSSASAQGLRAIISKLFNPLIEFISGPIGVIGKNFFYGLIIGALLLTVAVLRVRNALRDTFGGVSWFEGFDVGTAALYAGIAVIGALGLGVMLLGGALATLGAIIIVPVVLLRRWVSTLQQADAKLRGMSWADIGAALVNGLIDAIVVGIPRAIAAVVSLGSGIKTALGKALEIKSPSRVMYRMGLEVPRGFSLALTEGRAQVAAAARGMAAPVLELGGAAPGGRLPAPHPQLAEGRGGRSISLTVEPGAVVVNGEAGGDTAARIESALEALFERLAIQLGAQPT